jgi:hypothetical protein
MSVTVNAFTTENNDLDAIVPALINHLSGSGQFISGSSATGLCKYLLANAVLGYGIQLNNNSYGASMTAANTASGSLVSGSLATAYPDV